MSIIQNLDIVLGAKTQKLDKALVDEAAKVRQFKSVVSQAGANVAGSIPGASSFSGIFNGLSQATKLGGPWGAAIAGGAAVAVAGVAAVGVAWHNVSEQMREIDAISDAASKLGMTFRDLSNIRLSLAESSGLDPAAIDASMQRMQMGLAEAANTQSGDLFEKLTAAGLDAAELLKKGPAAAMEEIAAKTQNLQNPTDQLVIAYELFGKQGAALVNSLRDGPGAMREMAAFADRVGMNLSQAQAEQVGAANDAWERMSMVATGAWRQIAAEASPVLTVIYESITEGATQFSSYLDYLPQIVDNTAYFAGVLYDAYEASQVLHTTLRNIVSLNWDEVGQDIQSALSFDTGAANVAKIQQARENAAAEAKRKQNALGGGDSIIAALEREKEAKKEAAKAAEELAREAKREREQAERKLAADREAIADKFAAVRQELAIQQQLALMSASEAKKREQEIRERYALHAELREKGMTNFTEIDRLSNAANARKAANAERGRLADSASQIRRDQDPTIGLRETLRDLRAMVATGMLSAQQAQRAGLEATKKTMPEYKGAVSAQAGSVEAYKLMLDRENKQRGDELAKRKLAEEQLKAQQELNTYFKQAGVVTLRPAR